MTIRRYTIFPSSFLSARRAHRVEGHVISCEQKSVLNGFGGFAGIWQEASAARLWRTVGSDRLLAPRVFTLHGASSSHGTAFPPKLLLHCIVSHCGLPKPHSELSQNYLLILSASSTSQYLMNTVHNAF